MRGKPLANDVSLDMIAKRTIGFSGASLANLMNEAAIVAARRDKTEITYDEIDYAIDRQQVTEDRLRTPVLHMYKALGILLRQ